MRHGSPRLRRGLAAALVSLLTAASAGSLAARAAENNSNNADLAITKTASPSPDVAVGGEIVYTLTVNNYGPRPGTKAEIVDKLPSYVTFKSATVTRESTPADFCEEDGGEVYCRIHGNVRSGGIDNAVVTIVGTVNGRPADGELCNTATVTGNHDDPKPENNSSKACVTVIGRPTTNADLSIDKKADKATVSIGELLTYTVTVHNGGPDTAASVGVEDVLPANVEFVSVDPGPTTCSQAAGIVSCTLGSMANGADRIITIKVRPTAAAGGTVLTNRARVSATEDQYPDNNTDFVDTTVRARADLSITKTADKPTALIGEVLTYTITVNNAGPNTATGVVVTDDIPAQATLVSTSSSQGSCNLADPVLCQLGSLASGGSATVTIKVKPNAKGYIANTATVTANEEDLTPASSTTAPTAFVALSGGAFGESIDVRTLLKISVKSGPLASVSLPAGGGGPFTDSAVKVGVTGGLLLQDLLKIELLRASTEGGKKANGDIFVASSADVAKASLVNGLITVEGLHSDCLASTANGASRSSANIANLRIAGVRVNVAAGPNSTVTVPGVGQLILNEQVASGSGLNQTRSVNALHLKLDGLLAKGDIILAHSDCGIDP